MNNKNCFTFTLTEEEQKRLCDVLSNGNYIREEVPYTKFAVSTPVLRVNLYKNGKCVIQGKGARDFVLYVMEPMVLGKAIIDYEGYYHPERFMEHIGVDESGKGDYFGPLVVAGVYSSSDTVYKLRELGVRDSKRISSDNTIFELAEKLRRILEGKYTIVKINPLTYNRLYLKLRNINKILAWGHARAIENLLEKVPECPEALSDKFGDIDLVRNALMKRGKSIKLRMEVHAEEDPVVAAASILAREVFLKSLKRLSEEYGVKLPRGAVEVEESALKLIERFGNDVLVKVAKCHFKTTDKILKAAGLAPDTLFFDLDKE